VTFAEAEAAWLRTLLPVPGGIPCHDTLAMVFATLDPEAFQACYLAWVQAIVPSTAGQVVPIDGKALRVARASGSGQVAAAKQSNEITAVPGGDDRDQRGNGLPDRHRRRDCRVGDDYVLALKDNHPCLYEEVRVTFAQERKKGFAALPPGTHNYLRTVEKHHGRLEIRRHWPPAAWSSASATSATALRHTRHS